MFLDFVIGDAHNRCMTDITCNAICDFIIAVAPAITLDAATNLLNAIDDDEEPHRPHILDTLRDNTDFTLF